MADDRTKPVHSNQEAKHKEKVTEKKAPEPNIDPKVTPWVSTKTHPEVCINIPLGESQSKQLTVKLNHHIS